jgi:hypothetical protein
VQQNALYTLRKQLEAENFQADQIIEAQDFQHTVNDFAASKITWDTYIKERRAVQNKVWFSYLIAPNKQEDKSWTLLKENLDPTPLWEKVSIPILAMFGGVDIFMDASTSRENLERSLKIGHNKNYVIKYFPDGDHGMRQAKIGNTKESPYLKKYVTDFYTVTIKWLMLQKIL